MRVRGQGLRPLRALCCSHARADLAEDDAGASARRECQLNADGRDGLAAREEGGGDDEVVPQGVAELLAGRAHLDIRRHREQVERAALVPLLTQARAALSEDVGEGLRLGTQVDGGHSQG